VPSLSKRIPLIIIFLSIVSDKILAEN